jgi:hypothetical protein
MGEVFGWRRFFSGDFSGKRTADPERSGSSHTYYTSVDAVLAKDLPLRVSSIHLIPWGSYPQKLPVLETSMGISSLKRLGAYLGIGKMYHDA